MLPGLTVLNRYRLRVPPGAAAPAFAALAARVEAEGHPGVQSYRFFLNAAEGEGRAVIDYSGPEAWHGHHEIAMSWPEMTALHAAAHLTEVVFLGDLQPSIADWMERSALDARLIGGFAPAGGFRRG